MANDRNVQELQRANAELNTLVSRLLTDTDALFNSRTWSIGYRIANAVRLVQRLLGNTDAQVHIGPDHFRRVAASYFACQSRENTAVAVDRDGIPEIPKVYIVSDVEVVVRDLWSQVSRMNQEHG